MKEQIEKEVRENPGISFSELKDALDLANGQLQYYLRNANIEKRENSYISPSYCADCNLRKICEKKCIIGLLRDKKKSRIVDLLQDGKSKTEIASKVGIHNSTLTYHLGVLEENNVLNEGKVREEITSLF